MAAESILTYKKPGFPVTEKTPTGNVTTIEYVGPDGTLASAEPAPNDAWGDYVGFVKSTRIEPIEVSGYSTLTVSVEETFDSADDPDTPGTEAETTYEIEWVSFERSMFEHPEFSEQGNGAYKLTSLDWCAIQEWKNTRDTQRKSEYKYQNLEDAAFTDLSNNAQMFVRGLKLGQETYEDFAPVVRVTSNYVGGPPPLSTAGLKGNPPSFVTVPVGYEWRKSADRSVKSSAQRKWDRVQEWMGAKKVLTDRDGIFWTNV